MAGLIEKLLEKLGKDTIGAFAKARGVEDEIVSLASTLSTVKAVVEAAEEQAVNDKPLSIWLGKLLDAAYDADDLLEEFQMEAERHEAVIRSNLGEQVAHFFSPSNPFFFRLRMAGEIKEIRGRIDQIAAEMNMFHLKTGQPQDGPMVIDQKLIQGRETSSKMDKMSIVGRDGDKQSILRRVMDTETKENVSIISIVGMGGLGKTTLARLVYNEESVLQKHFSLRIWVYVSMDFDPRRIGKAMMECMTGQKCKLQIFDVICNQLEEKLKGKRFLIVLDDVWNENPSVWEQLKPIFDVGARGSKIIVTTRSEEVASVLKTTTIHRLKGLSEEDCWDLFKQRAFEGGNEEQDPSIVEIGIEIVKKCGGVPLAAKALGSIMRSKKGKEAWLAVRDSKMWLAEDKDGVLSSLRMSYTCLPSHLKQCFTYCSIFPKGFAIDKDDLIAQWIAQGFISSTVEGRQMEDIGNEYFNDLLWLSFFQDLEVHKYRGRVTCKMHDLMHDLAQHVAGSCRWLALMDRDISLAFPTSLKKMRGLKFYWTLEESCTFKFAPSTFSNAQCLRVLDLGDVHIESLPASMSNLRNLRYLRVSCEKLLPESFYNLQNLRTFYLTDCHGLEKIPESVSRLHSLRSLVLENCEYPVTLPESIGDLHELRTLEVNSGGGLEAIPESIGKLHNLQRINLCFCPSLMELPDSVGSLSNLQELCLRGCRELSRLPESISNLVRLEKLDLEHCSRLKELPHGLGNLMNVRCLITERCSSLCGMPLGVGRLTNLQELSLFVVGDCRDQRYAKVSELEHLNKISGDLVIEGLQNVRDPADARRAKLKEMRNLSSLSLDWINTPSDDVDEEASCEDGEASEEDEEAGEGDEEASEGDEEAGEGDEEAVLESLQPHPNIKKLEIRNYPGVSFPKWIESSPFPTLEYIKLVGMRNWEHLPPLGLLPSLRDLRIEGMDAVKRVGAEFYGIGHHSGNRTVPFPSLERLNFEYMRNLEEWCTVVEGDVNSSSGHRAPPPFPCLSTLEIDECPKLSLHPGFPASVVDLTVQASNEELLSEQSFQQNASCLRELTISRCHEMGSLPKSLRYLTSLRTLNLLSCHEMNSLPEWLGDLSSLNSLGIHHCPGLSCLPEGLQRLTALQALHITGCRQLARRCKRDQGEDWHIIAHIPNIKITARWMLSSLICN